MSTGSVLVIAVPVLFALALAGLVSMRRRDRAVGRLASDTREAGGARARRSLADRIEAEARQRYRREEPPDGRTPRFDPSRTAGTGVDRRRFLNRSMVSVGAVVAGGLGSSILAFLWPNPASGFGSKVVAGDAGDIAERIASSRAPVYVPQARSYLSAYPESALAQGKAAYDDRLHPGLDAGFVALFQTCPHLGCRVPWCGSSQWFECPCHASKYNRVGEKRRGPAPRGMDRFPISIEHGQVVIDTGQRVNGPNVGVETIGQEPEGPHCVTG